MNSLTVVRESLCDALMAQAASPPLSSYHVSDKSRVTYLHRVAVQLRLFEVLYTFVPAFQPPVITGESTVVERSTLSLDCDASNSAPLPSVVWLNPRGETVSNSRILIVNNIQRSAAGTYMCVARVADSQLISSVTVNVLMIRKSRANKEELLKFQYIEHIEASVHNA